MGRPSKRKLLLLSAIVIFCALLALGFIPRSGDTEARLQWRSANIRGKDVTFLAPTGWVVDPDFNNHELVRFVPPSSVSPWPRWLTALTGRTFGEGQDYLMIWRGMTPKNTGEQEVVQPLRFRWRTVYTSRRYFFNPVSPNVYYNRLDKAAFDATHKRICDSLQLVH